MPDGNRHGYITLGWIATIIGLLLFGTLGHLESTSKYQSSYYAERCAEQYSAKAGATANGDTVTGNSETKQSDEKQEDHPNWCDLAAQQNMAESAMWTKWATWSGVIFTGVGIFLVWQTLEANRQGTAAARAAVEHAEKTSKLELRAYIAVAPKGVVQLIGTQKVIGEVEVRNVGQLPARKVSIHVRMGVFTHRILDPAELAIDADPVVTDQASVDRVIQPGDSLEQGARDPEPLVAVSYDSEFVYVWGVVYYGDGFEKRRFTRFCHRYAVAGRNHEFDEDRPDFVPTSRRCIIDTKAARYHQIGNDAD